MKGIGLDVPAQLGAIFPFHFAIDRDLRIVQVAPAWLRVGGPIEVGASIPDRAGWCVPSSPSNRTRCGPSPGRSWSWSASRAGFRSGGSCPRSSRQTAWCSVGTPMVRALALAGGGQVKAIRVPGKADMTRREIDGLTEIARKGGARGLAYIGYLPGELRSPVAKFLSDDELKAVRSLSGAADGDLLLLVADQPSVVAASLHQVRDTLGNHLGLKDANVLSFAWVTGFPLLEWHPEEGRWDATHNPFSGFKEDQRPLLDSDPGKVISRQYDLTLNGSEVGGGSIRINTRQDQEKIFLGPADILPPEPPLDSHTFYLVVNKNTNERHLTPFKPDYEWHVSIGRVVVHDDGQRIRAVEVDGQRFEIKENG